VRSFSKLLSALLLIEQGRKEDSCRDLLLEKPSINETIGNQLIPRLSLDDPPEPPKDPPDPPDEPPRWPPDPPAPPEEPPEPKKRPPVEEPPSQIPPLRFQ
jgi:outer membrane biosynthesis protein TonB